MGTCANERKNVCIRDVLNNNNNNNDTENEFIVTQTQL